MMICSLHLYNNIKCYTVLLEPLCIIFAFMIFHRNSYTASNVLCCVFLFFFSSSLSLHIFLRTDCVKSEHQAKTKFFVAVADDVFFSFFWNKECVSTRLIYLLRILPAHNHLNECQINENILYYELNWLKAHVCTLYTLALLYSLIVSFSK